MRNLLAATLAFSSFQRVKASKKQAKVVWDSERNFFTASRNRRRINNSTQSRFGAAQNARRVRLPSLTPAEEGKNIFNGLSARNPLCRSWISWRCL
jgi:hypothetical protein